MSLMEQLRHENLKDLSHFRVGDTVKIHYKIKEAKTERIQIYEGVVISIRGIGVQKMITVRKISFNVGVERIFPLYSPLIDKIEVSQMGKVRRAKLYYLRDKIGKKAKVKVRFPKKV